MSALIADLTYTREDLKIEKAIINYFDKNPNSVEFKALIEEIAKLDFDVFEIKENIWNLINKGSLDFVEGYKLAKRSR